MIKIKNKIITYEEILLLSNKKSIIKVIASPHKIESIGTIKVKYLNSAFWKKPIVLILL